MARRTAKVFLSGGRARKSPRPMVGESYTYALRRTNVGVLEGVCVSCGKTRNAYVHISLSGQLAPARCSHCGGLLCTRCYGRSFYDLGTPLFQHICRLYTMVPYTTTNGSMWLLCKNCKKEIGIRENSSRKIAVNKREVSLNLDEFLEHADVKYRQSGRLEELAQLYELCGLHDQAREARTRR